MCLYNREDIVGWLLKHELFVISQQEAIGVCAFVDINVFKQILFPNKTSFNVAVFMIIFYA